jgi:hypothetical protein
LLRKTKSIRQTACQQPLAFHKCFCEARSLLTWQSQVSKQKQKGLEKSKKQNQNSKIFKARQHLLKNQKDSAKQKIFYFPKASCQKVSGVPKFFQVARTSLAKVKLGIKRFLKSKFKKLIPKFSKSRQTFWQIILLC